LAAKLSRLDAVVAGTTTRPHPRPKSMQLPVQQSNMQSYVPSPCPNSATEFPPLLCLLLMLCNRHQCVDCLKCRGRTSMTSVESTAPATDDAEVPASGEEHAAAAAGEEAQEGGSSSQPTAPAEGGGTDDAATDGEKTTGPEPEAPAAAEQSREAEESQAPEKKRERRCGAVKTGFQTPPPRPPTQAPEWPGGVGGRGVGWGGGGGGDSGSIAPWLLSLRPHQCPPLLAVCLPCAPCNPFVAAAESDRGMPIGADVIVAGAGNAEGGAGAENAEGGAGAGNAERVAGMEEVAAATADVVTMMTTAAAADETAGTAAAAAAATVTAHLLAAAAAAAHPLPPPPLPAPRRVTATMETGPQPLQGSPQARCCLQRWQTPPWLSRE
jgi:hypothetical protein